MYILCDAATEVKLPLQVIRQGNAEAGRRGNPIEEDH